jgi:hypothetical protein
MFLQIVRLPGNSWISKDKHMLLDEQIDKEVRQYLVCCEKIAKHSEDEAEQRGIARALFRHIEELKNERRHRFV